MNVLQENPTGYVFDWYSYWSGWNAALTLHVAPSKPVAYLTVDGDDVVTAKLHEAMQRDRDNGLIYREIQSYPVAAYTTPPSAPVDHNSHLWQHIAQCAHGLLSRIAENGYTEDTVKELNEWLREYVTTMEVCEVPVS